MSMRVNPRTIILTLKKHQGKAADTAKELGIHRSTVYRWVKRARDARGNLSSRGLKRKSTRRPHTTTPKVLFTEHISQLIGVLREKVGQQKRLPTT